MAENINKAPVVPQRDVDKRAAALRENLKRRKSKKSNQVIIKGKQDENNQQKN